MGKSNKAKKEFRNAVEMVGLIQTLKDIADNKFYTLTNKRNQFKRFGETFMGFFRMIKLTQASHPLMSNNIKTVGILTVTVEGSFLGEFNNKIIRLAIEESKKHDNAKFMAVGNRSTERLSQIESNLKIFPNMEKFGMYETARMVKDYVVDLVNKQEIGKLVVIYCWPRSFDLQRPRMAKVLPCESLLSKRVQLGEGLSAIIQESNASSIIGSLCDLWIMTRLYEIFMDTTISSAAAQAKFLDDSVEKMKKERKKMAIKFRKAKKSDIDKSLRETFSARMMAEK